jgi:putative peptidoglycan lipid II flippase
MSNTHQSITKAASTMGLATATSRVLGMARDSVSSRLFGAGWVSDAFIIAFRIPNLLRDLLAEGALSAAFVPAMTKERQLHGKEGAWLLASLMLNSLVLLMAALVLLGIQFSPQLVASMAPGFEARQDQFSLTVFLTRLLFPFLSMMVFSSLLMGILISRKHFVTGAIAPVFLNLTILLFGAGIHFFLPRNTPPEKLVVIWAWGYLCAGLVQFLVHVPPVWTEGFKWRLAWPFGDLRVRKIWGQMLPAVLGQSGTQINLWVNSAMASSMVVGSATDLYYGNRMMLLPLGIFAVAISTAVLPTLSSQHGNRDSQAFKKTLGYGLRLTLFCTLPAAAGLVMLSEPINVLLFRGGRFSVYDALNAADACSLYSLGIVFASFIKVLGPAFYAREEASIPVKVSIVGVAINIAISLSLRDTLGFRALALATSLSNLAQACMLIWLIRRRLGNILRAEIFADFAKIALCTAAMCLAVWGAQSWWEKGLAACQLYGRPRLAQGSEVMLLIALATGVYFSLSRALGLDYLGALMGRRARLAPRVVEEP